ncbi:Ribosomal RNA-processing protein 12 [Hypsizygus marmoreus]|uniref:Ribosomal RNA-processing protein 12 n=1 Tax=Hypsizygus marmoreus TaxID=39966 RepID=A0A369JXB0_HYPMA|nr:Ribosomal RNA-processing protein 12 [Hypsizygus marmoreus]
MEQALSKIRPHTSSALAHQKTPAILLIALESTFREQKTDSTPTAYFAALLTTLDGTIHKQRSGSDEAHVLHAELYLLGLIAPFVPFPVIRTNLNTILSLTGPLFPSLNPHAPALRSQLSLYHAVFQSLDRTQLDTQGIRQIFASILQLCLDLRPKVRRKAADVVKDILAAPPTPLVRHPYSARVAEWIKSALSDVSAGPLSKPKTGRAPETSGPDTAIHIVAFLRPVLPNLPPASIPPIANLLLALPRLGNPYLSRSTYSVLSDLFSLPPEDGTQVGEHLSDVLNVVLSSPPSKSDTTLSPAWVNVLGNAFSVYQAPNAEAYAAELGKVWKTIWGFLESSDAPTRKAAAQSLGVLCRCFTPALISSALQDRGSKSTLGKIIAQATEALNSLSYARAMPELLSILSSLITSLRYSPGPPATPTAAESLLLPLIKHVGDLRIQKGFEYKEDADATLATAMSVLGPEVLLRVLPLNLEPSDRQAGGEPRAYLLPLLPQQHPSPLGHFVSYFVPLSERMFDLQSTAEAEGRQSEAKVWSVLVAQIWSGLSGYCWGTRDLKQSLTPSFSQLLSQLLYGQPELRPAVLKALKIMVDSNVALASLKEREIPSRDVMSPAEAAQNVAFLQTQAESWLAVFFNVFGTVGRDSRGMIGDAISVWASIADEQEITKAFGKVVNLFKTNMADSEKAPPQHTGQHESGSLTATTQDILILLLPYLSATDATALFQLCMTPEVLGGKDNGVQKRGYKILTKTVESGKISLDAEAVIRRLEELSDGLSPAAKKDRFNLLSLIIPRIPSSAMHVIPSLIPEAVLGTKEPSEKARTAAFEVILAMGRKMNEGGVVKRNLIDGMDEESVTDTAANVEEFLTMLAGGLAASPHMISATVTAISRLVFEFKDIISPKMHTEIFTTLLVFLSSANREIVKSILGFIKLAVHTLPTEIIQPHLKELVPALLAWSHDHKNHFKAKVRHIFERMIRRFGWDEVYSCAGEEEAAKVLVNIKKRKERAKRKKNNRNDGGEEETVAPAKAATGDAFEDVLYGSESELDDSEDEMPSQPTKPSKKKAQEHGARLRVDDDEPMDLLQGAASRITNAGSNRRRKPGQDAAHFKTDEDTGKMIIDGENSSDNEDAGPSIDVAGTAYRESITSVDGFTRGPNGRVKFNKDTKKRRREVDEAEDVEMADREATVQTKKTKRKAEPNLGHEFKAKKAGGDIKKKGIDPYAYMSLSQAAKKGGHGRRSNLGIAGKSIICNFVPLTDLM